MTQPMAAMSGSAHSAVMTATLPRLFERNFAIGARRRATSARNASSLVMVIMVHLLRQVLSKPQLLENGYWIRWFKVKSSCLFSVLGQIGGPKIRRRGAGLRRRCHGRCRAT